MTLCCDPKPVFNLCQLPFSSEIFRFAGILYGTTEMIFHGRECMLEHTRTHTPLTVCKLNWPREKHKSAVVFQVIYIKLLNARPRGQQLNLFAVVWLARNKTSTFTCVIVL